MGATGSEAKEKGTVPRQPDHAGPSWLPAVRDGVGKKWKCHAIHDRPSTGKHIIDAVRDANTSSVRAEVVVVDQPWRQNPNDPEFLKGPSSSQSLISR